MADADALSPEGRARLREIAERATRTPLVNYGVGWTASPELSRHLATFDPPTTLAILDRLEALERVRSIGQRMSNVLHNWAQRPGYVLDKRECEGMRSVYLEWDAALRALDAPEKEEQSRG